MWYYQVFTVFDSVDEIILLPFKWIFFFNINFHIALSVLNVATPGSERVKVN